MGKAIYVKSKIDGNEYCKTNGQFTKHLKKHELTYQTYYEKYVTKIEMKCRCGKPMTFYQQTETYASSCGDSMCIGKLISVTKKNWTVEQKQQDSDSKKKSAASRTTEEKVQRRNRLVQTNQQKYGVDFTTQSSQMMDKSKVTKKERYGDENYSNPKKTSDSWQAKTSAELNIIADKKRTTCVEKYGVSNPFFLPNVRKRSAVANSIGREFTLPSGKIIRVRGYEDAAIVKLLKDYSESELVLDDTLVKYNLPIFTYIDNRRHILKYYPDIFIPKENKIIEIKGRWWWDGNGIHKHKSRLFNNLKKRKAVLNAGYQYEVWLFEDRKNYRVLKDESDFIIE